MKVLHFYKTHLPDTVGGVEQVINQLALSSKKLGVESSVLTLSSTKNFEPNIEVSGYRVHRCKTNFSISSMPCSIQAIQKFKQLVAEHDIIHYHFPYPLADLLHFITQVKKPTLVSYHADIIKQRFLLRVYQPLQQRFLRSVDKIVVASPNYLALSKPLRALQHKCSLIPYGLDKSTYPVPTEAQINYWQAKFGLCFFLFIGVLRYYKGLHILIKAAKNSPYPIIIAGAGSMERKLQQQVKSLGVQNVYFIGFVTEIEKVALIKACYALVLPSHLRSEAFGISLLEGAMYGRALISTDMGTGTSYVNLHTTTGLVVEPNNPTSLRQAMDYLFFNPGQAEKMGEAASRRYLEKFTAQQMVKSYVDLYHRLLK